MKTTEERFKMSWQGWFYAIQRIDLLIVSICGAGIYIVLETLKFSKTTSLGNLSVLKTAGLLFVLAIIVNFISQFTGKKANEHDMLMCKEQLSEDDKKNIEKEKNHDCLAGVYTSWTNTLNVISLIIMLSGLLIILIYFMITF